MSATIRDVARRAGVTDTTVSLAFQQNSRISDQTRRSVLAVARKLGYVPNSSARQLRGGNSRVKTLGLLVPELVNPFYALVFEAVVQVGRKRGYQVVLSDSLWQAENEVSAIHGMIASNVDGVLACFSETRDSLALLERYDVRYLALDTCFEKYAGAYVFNDLEEAGRLAANHLADIGCRRLAFVNAGQDMAYFSAFHALLRSFRQTLSARKIQFGERDVICAGLTIAAGESAYASMKARNPDGVFCVNGLCTLGILDAASNDGRKNLAIMGVDDLDVCRLSRISLTTIRQPFEQLATVAADVLINSIEAGETPNVRLSLKPELIVRGSTSHRLKS